jgi:hypothetical protein
MNIKRSVNILLVALSLTGLILQGCNKHTSTSPFPVASLNVVNALPNSAPLILVQGSISSVIGDFSNIGPLSYAATAVLTPMSGPETLYAVQSNADTTSVGSKAPDFMFNGELNFKAGSLYSLFITGEDTTNPDFLFVQDVLPVQTDSSVGIRFVNLSTGSNPMSINLEGNSTGSEVGNLPYKSITTFKDYVCNSTINNYLFVVRDVATGDSLTQFVLNSNNGYGLTDPNNGNLLKFKHVTIAVYGSESITSSNPLNTMLIDNY